MVAVAIDDVLEPIALVVLVLNLYDVSLVNLAVVPVRLIPSYLDGAINIVVDIEIDC